MGPRLKLLLFALLIALAFGGVILHFFIVFLALLNRGFIETTPALPFQYEIMKWYWTNDWKAYLTDLLMILAIWGSLLKRAQNE